jgi:hypothetical protein
MKIECNGVELPFHMSYLYCMQYKQTIHCTPNEIQFSLTKQGLENT